MYNDGYSECRVLTDTLYSSLTCTGPWPSLPGVLLGEPHPSQVCVRITLIRESRLLHSSLKGNFVVAYRYLIFCMMLGMGFSRGVFNCIWSGIQVYKRGRQCATIQKKNLRVWFLLILKRMKSIFFLSIIFFSWQLYIDMLISCVITLL